MANQLGAWATQTKTTSAVEMSMRSSSQERPKRWSVAELRNKVSAAKEGLNGVLTKELNLRTIRPNPDAIKNVTSGGGKRTAEARIARSLAKLEELNKQMEDGFSHTPGKGYSISDDAIQAANSYEKVAAATTKIAESIIEAGDARKVERNAVKEQEAAAQRKKEIAEINVEVNGKINADPVLSAMRSKFHTPNATATVNRIRGDLSTLDQLQKRSLTSSGVTVDEIKQARQLRDSLMVMQLQRYKAEALEETRLARQVDKKEALADLTMLLADVDWQLQERNWSASSVVNPEAKLPTGRVGHLRAEFDVIAKQIESSGDKVEGDLLEAAQKKHAEMRKVFDTELLNRELRTRVQEQFDDAYSIAKERFGNVSPDARNKGTEDKDKVEFLLGKLQNATRAIDKATAAGHKVTFANSFTQENIEGSLAQIKEITGIDSPVVNAEIVDDGIQLMTQAELVDEVYEQLRDLVKKGDGTWKGRRGSNGMTEAEAKTPQDKVSIALGKLTKLKLEAKAAEEHAKAVSGQLEFKESRDFEAEATEIFEEAVVVIRDYVATETSALAQEVSRTAAVTWKDIEAGETYPADPLKTKYASLMKDSGDLAARQEGLEDLALIAEANKFVSVSEALKAPRLAQMNNQYRELYEKAQSRYQNFPEEPMYAVGTKDGRETVESRLGSIRGMVNMAIGRRVNGQDIADSWLERVDNDAAIVNEHFLKTPEA